MAGINKDCQYCGGRIKKARKKQKFCSISCSSSSRKGEANNNWKGGKMLNCRGYIEIRDPKHHRAKTNGYVYEHILVAEDKIGRRLKEKEVVHHIDGNRSNNNPSNIEAMPLSEHMRLRAIGRPGLRGEKNPRWLKTITEDKIILAILAYKTKKEAAVAMGINPATLYKRLKYYKERNLS